MTNNLDLARRYLLRLPYLVFVFMAEIATWNARYIDKDKKAIFRDYTQRVLRKRSIRSHEQRTHVGAIEHRRYHVITDKCVRTPSFM